LNNPEWYSISLPASLDPTSPNMPNTFKTSVSRPSVLKGMDQGQSSEIIGTVCNTLGRDFNIPAGTGVITASAMQGGGAKDTVRNLVLIGASNLKRAIPYLNAMGYQVLDMCTPGWRATPENVAILVEKIKSVNLGADVGVVMDLFGNSCTRYVDFDGTISRPYRDGRGYHLPGEVTVCKEDIFEKIVETVLPVVDSVPDHVKVVVPPQPRYLHSPCCDSQAHCVNIGTESYAEQVVSSNLRLRAVLKKKLLEKRIKNHWVADSCCYVKAVKDFDAKRRAETLRAVSAGDGVHYTPDGYGNFAGNVAEMLKSFKNRSAAVSVSGSTRRFHWRGFTSPVGSLLSVPSAPSWKAPTRGKPHHAAGPYRR